MGETLLPKTQEIIDQIQRSTTQQDLSRLKDSIERNGLSSQEEQEAIDQALHEAEVRISAKSNTGEAYPSSPTDESREIAQLAHENLSYASRIESLRNAVRDMRNSGKLSKLSLDQKLEKFKILLHAVNGRQSDGATFDGKVSSLKQEIKKSTDGVWIPSANYNPNYSESLPEMILYANLFFENPPKIAHGKNKAFYIPEIHLDHLDDIKADPVSLPYILDELGKMNLGKVAPVVKLQNGVYGGSMSLRANKVTIEPAEGAHPVIEGDGEGGSALLIAGNNCCVRGVVFQNIQNPTAIQSTGGGTRIEQCTMKNVDTGVLSVGEDFTMSGCMIDRYGGDGILCLADNQTITNNTIKDAIPGKGRNTGRSAENSLVHQDAIQFAKGDQNNPYENRFSGQTIRGLRVTGNTVVNGYQGITAFQCRVDDSIFTHNSVQVRETWGMKLGQIKQVELAQPQYGNTIVIHGSHRVDPREKEPGEPS